MAVVFERTVQQAKSRSSFFIRLESDDDAGLSNVLPQSVYIAEALSYGSPIVTVTFKDQYGVYMNLLKIDPNTRFDLHIGETVERAVILPLKLSRIDMTNNVSGKGDNLSFKISFVHHGWNDFINKRRCRGWSDATPSEIVSSIASECLFDETITSESKPLPNIVQPHWSNNIFLRWLQENAISEKYDDHYEFCGRIDNKFMFKTLSDIIEENRDKAVSGEIPVITLNGYADKPTERNEMKSDNDETPPYFLSFSSTEYYMDSVVNGGGFKAMHYDFENGSLVTTPVVVGDMNSFMMSDWASIKQDNEQSNIIFNEGRDIKSVDNAKSRLSSVQMSMNQFRVMTEGSINRHVGDMVEVIIPTPSNMIPPFSILYSGFYVIASITHQLAIEPTPNIVSTIELTRHGFDGVDLTGYSSTSLGKFVSGDNNV